MRCVQRRACPRPLNLNLFPTSPTPLINYYTAKPSLTVATSIELGSAAPLFHRIATTVQFHLLSRFGIGQRASASNYCTCPLYETELPPTKQIAAWHQAQRLDELAQYSRLDPKTGSLKGSSFRSRTSFPGGAGLVSERIVESQRNAGRADPLGVPPFLVVRQEARQILPE